jgi:hypothetical protein
MRGVRQILKERGKMKYFVRVLTGFTLHIVILFSIIFSQMLLFTADACGITASEYLKYANSIIDHSQNLNPLFKKIKRNRTQYIIIHTSECDLKTTLKIVSKGKQENHRWVSRGGHTHYVIARNGQTYSILGHEYRIIPKPMLYRDRTGRLPQSRHNCQTVQVDSIIN